MRSKTLLILLVCMLTGISSLAQTTARRQALSYVQEGDNFLKHGNWEDAIFSYTNAINADPAFAKAYMKRAKLYERLDRNREVAYVMGNQSVQGCMDLNYSAVLGNKRAETAIEYLCGD